MGKETPGSILAKLLKAREEGRDTEETKSLRKDLDDATVRTFKEEGIKCTIVRDSDESE